MILLQAADWSLFFGRFHPLIVHLPIGFLILAGLMEWLGRKPKFQILNNAVSFTLFTGAVSAVMAVILGLMLSNEGGYDENTLFWHKWLGISLALFSIVAWLVKSGRFAAAKSAYSVLLGTMLFLLLLTGHFGGSLTHGSNYLWQYAPGPIAALFGSGTASQIELAPITDPDSAVVFTHLIQPMLEKRCVGCHNEDKSKGGLKLTSEAYITEGGEGGAVIVPGNAQDSEIFRRVTLPQDHRKFMPADNQTPLTYDQIQLLQWWINSGASFDASMAEIEMPDHIKYVLENNMGISTKRRPYVEIAKVDPVDAKIIEDIRSRGLAISPLADGNNFLDVRPSATGQDITAEHIKALLPAAEQITWLNLGKAGVTDEMIEPISQFTNLTRLRLEQNPVTDLGVSYLENLKHLEYLNLYGTEVSDSSLASIRQMPALRKLFLWQTNVTPEAVEKLQQERPKLQIEMGFEFKQVSIDTEG